MYAVDRYLAVLQRGTFGRRDVKNGFHRPLHVGASDFYSCRDSWTGPRCGIKRGTYDVCGRIEFEISLQSDSFI